MIILFHKNNKVTKVLGADKSKISFKPSKSVAFVIMQLAVQFRDQKIVWCEAKFETCFDFNTIDNIMPHNKMMLSYNSTGTYLGNAIGYIEESPFIHINKNVTYPTWQMSSAVGVIHASVLVLFKDKINLNVGFDYFLNSVAKVGMPLGLLCYSEPRLIINKPKISLPKASVFTIFKFVKQHYKTRWLFLLLVNLLVYEFRFPFFAFLYGLFFKNKNKNNNAPSLATIEVQSNSLVIDTIAIDVIIPTIGRKKYLYDVLQDLAKQTHLPINVIIVEQNPEENSVSELDYLQNQDWPFVIKHTFTHQAGACNARNIALAQVTSQWTFFADDDIRIENDFIEKVCVSISKFGVHAVSINCIQKNQKPVFKNVFQWSGFGSGCSFVASHLLKKCVFTAGFEFGFGEDNDFGMQLRNLGCDVLYLPNPMILHLKAPVGGFRFKPELQWQADLIQPKPSPTVMLYKVLHSTNEQISSYKITLFFKYYRVQSIKNPIKYFFYFKKQWNKSVYWATVLNSKS